MESERRAMTKRIRRWLLAGAAAALAAASLPAAEAIGAIPTAPTATASQVEFESAPHQFIADTSRRLLALIESGRSYADEDPERFFAALESLLSTAVDFEGFARRVMAGHNRRATAQQRTRFTEIFKWSLIRTYALALTEFNDGEVVVLPPDGPARHPARRAVKTEIHDRGEVYSVIYTTVLQDGGWRIGNIIIAGVNIGLTFRSQFASMAADNRYGGDLDRVIDAWADFVGEGLETNRKPERP